MTPATTAKVVGSEENDQFFTKEELSSLGQKTIDGIKSALNEKDFEKAEKLTERMYREFLGMHDLYRDWITAMLSEVGKRYGDVELKDILHNGLRASLRPLFQKFDEGKADSEHASRKRKIRMFIAGLRGHLGPMEVTETDDYIVIKMTPCCWSGGRLITSGRYDGEFAFLRISAPQDMTYQTKDYPVYCAHQAIHEMIEAEETGSPFAVLDQGVCFGDACCSYRIYKNPDKMPQKYWTRLGLVRDVDQPCASPNKNS